MEDPLKQLLAGQLKHADVSEVLFLVREQMRKNPDWRGFAQGLRLEKIVRTEIIRHCEEAAEFCAAGTSNERREEIAVAWWGEFEDRVRMEVERAGGKRGLSVADVNEVESCVMSKFFDLDALDHVLREDSLAIYASDVLEEEVIREWFMAGSPLAVFLFQRGTTRAALDAVKRRGFIERGLSPSMIQCLSLLNGLVNDPEPWPDALRSQVSMGSATIAAGAVAGSGLWERRRYRRMLLNDLFAGALEPRLGYSPRLGPLRRYLEQRLLLSRLRDELDRYVRERERGGVVNPVPANEYPLLNADQVNEPAGFVRALTNPSSLVGRHWMEAIARVDPAMAERCRMAGEGIEGMAPVLSDLVGCLNSAMEGAAVIPPGTADDPGFPLRLRVFLATAPRAYPLRGIGLTLFNRRTLEIGFAGWIPEPPVREWDDSMEDDEMPEDGDPVPVLLQDPYLRAVLDLLLVTRIPGDRFGRATMTGLAWYGAMDGRKDPEVLAELMRWLRLEHEEALREWGELGVRGGRDLRDRETQQRAVEQGEEVLGRVADETIRKVIGHLEARAGKSLLGLEGDRLREAFRSLARRSEIGVMERILVTLKSSKDLRDAADAAAVMECGLAEARWARAEARQIELKGEREAYETHRGRWVRSQADVGRYLGRDQTAICRALRKKSKQGTPIKLATDFAEKRAKGFPFAHEDADPVGPGRASVGATGSVVKASRGMEVVR